MAGEQGSAYFFFDSNIDTATAKVRKGLSELSSMVAAAEAKTNAQAGALRGQVEPLAQGQSFNRVTGGVDFAAGIGNIRSEVQRLSGDLKAGNIGVDQFRAGLENMARSGIAAIPAQLGTALSQVPETLRNSLNMKEIARGGGDAIIQTITDEVARSRK